MTTAHYFTHTHTDCNPLSDHWKTRKGARVMSAALKHGAGCVQHSCASLLMLRKSLHLACAHSLAKRMCHVRMK